MKRTKLSVPLAFLASLALAVSWQPSSRQRRISLTREASQPRSHSRTPASRHSRPSRPPAISRHNPLISRRRASRTPTITCPRLPATCPWWRCSASVRSAQG